MLLEVYSRVLPLWWRMRTGNLIRTSAASVYIAVNHVQGKPQQPWDSLVYVGRWRCAATRIHYRNYFASKLCSFVVISSYICKPTVRFVMFVVCMMSAIHLIWVSCQYIEVDFAYEFVAIVATVVLEAVLVRCSLSDFICKTESVDSDHQSPFPWMTDQFTHSLNRSSPTHSRSFT